MKCRTGDMPGLAALSSETKKVIDVGRCRPKQRPTCCRERKKPDDCRTSREGGRRIPAEVERVVNRTSQGAPNSVVVSAHSSQSSSQESTDSLKVSNKRWSRYRELAVLGCGRLRRTRHRSRRWNNIIRPSTNCRTQAWKAKPRKRNSPGALLLLDVALVLQLLELRLDILLFVVLMGGGAVLALRTGSRLLLGGAALATSGSLGGGWASGAVTGRLLPLLPAQLLQMLAVRENLLANLFDGIAEK
ncbi:hypothetical protein VTI74DRAFT_10229 [Chaetomium olivicolor]